MEMREDYTTEPRPEPKEGKQDTYPLAMEDAEKRVEAGRIKYEATLLPNNGRDALIDAYRDAIVLAFYLLRQLIDERDD